MLQKPSLWLIALGLATVYLVWGSTYLAIRVAVETMPPFLMASARFLVAGTVNPIVAVFLGWFFLGEPVNPRIFVAGSIIVFGVATITYSRGRRKH